MLLVIYPTVSPSLSLEVPDWQALSHSISLCPFLFISIDLTIFSSICLPLSLSRFQESNKSWDCTFRPDDLQRRLGWLCSDSKGKNSSIFFNYGYRRGQIPAQVAYFLKNGSFPASFSLFFFLSTVNSYMFCIIFCLWLDSNCKPLVFGSDRSDNRATITTKS